MNTSLYLRRRRRIFISPTGTQNSPELLATLLKNIHPFGFTLSPAAQEQVAWLSKEQMEIFYLELVIALEELTGAGNNWKPFYPNFPAQVMAMSEAELYLNALVHYLTNLRPNYENEADRPKFDDRVHFKIIDWGSTADFESIFTTLTASKSSPSESDRNDLRWFTAHYRDDVHRLIAGEVPSRETLALLGAALLKDTTFGTEWVASKTTTATDVLRLAVAMQDGDVSLASLSVAAKREEAKAFDAQESMWKNYLLESNYRWAQTYLDQVEIARQDAAKKRKFQKLTRAQRKLLLQLLENCPNATEDMLRWQIQWVRLGEKLHPGEWEKRFPIAFAAFEVVRGNTEFQTFNTKVELALLEGKSDSVLELLKTRPGDFARRLDHLLRRFPAERAAILETFGGVANRISTPVLLQILTHFKHRGEAHDLRIFFPKGQVAKVWGQRETLQPLDGALCQSAVNFIEGVLLARFAELPPLGNCYLDPELDNFLAPFSQRSASKALRTVARGSRMPLPDANTVRFFLWWRNGKERTDLDLSAVIYDADFIYKDVLSYYNLKDYGGTHSGDIVDAPDGAAEFIDLDCAKLLEKGACYVVMSVNSFTSQPYCDLPECFAGWMAREKPDSGEIFEARTVQDRIDLSSDTQICLPLVIDLESRSAVWMDLSLKDSPSWNNVRNNLNGVSLMLRAMLNLEKATLYDLFALHVAARGHLVATKEEADQVFAVHEGLTPFDLDVIGSQWM